MIGGIVEACSLQPLDVLKTRLQLGRESIAVIARNMLYQEGVRAFYKGLTPFATHLVTKYSVRWYFNEFYRGLLKDKKTGKVTTTSGFLAGLGSGITEAVLIVTPFELIKTRLQQQKGTDSSQHKYKGLFSSAKTIVSEEGVAALWKGNVPTMLRQGINQLFLFGTYDQLKYALFNKGHDDVISSFDAVLLGIVAGALGPFANNPVDVAKTRLMAQLPEPGKEPKYRGTFHCIGTVFQEEGVKALMRGCLMRVARVAPGMGLTFMCVEKVKEFGKEYDKRGRE